MSTSTTPRRPMGLEHPAVLDAFAHDKRRDTLILAMYETRPWTGNENHILQLQEKLNAYASFVLDGEMAESFPAFVGKPVEIQLRTRHQPDPLTLGFLNQAKNQLSLQLINLETIRIESAEEFEPASSSPACGCGQGGCGS
ncbi:MAG: DUF6572 domain-containing protein [bacterium]